LRSHPYIDVFLLTWLLLSCENPFAPKPTQDEDLFKISHDYSGGSRIVHETPITITWSEITIDEFEKYTIYRSILENGEEVWEQRSEITNPLQVSYIDILDDDLTYRYKVHMEDANGNYRKAETDLIVFRTTSIIVPDEYDSMQEVYDSAFIDDGDTILVNLVYPSTFEHPFEFIGKEVCIKSVMGKEETVLRYGGWVVSINRGIFSGFTIIKGGVNIFGTAILDDCIITGVYAPGITPVLVSDTAVVQNCIISNNTQMTGLGSSGDGGGMIIRDHATIRNCRITANRAERSGGGIYIYGESTIINCVINNNYAEKEGGGMIIEGNPFIVNSIIDNNFSVEGGGGLFVSFMNSNPIIVNCVVYGNKTGLNGGRWGAAFIEKYTKLTMINSIVWQNSSSGSEDWTWQNAAYCDIQGYIGGTGNINSSPRFIDPLFRDFHLLPDSPCIDVGTPASEYNDTDGTRNDIGAYGGPYGDW